MDANFHEERKSGIGGSDMPVILGVSPFGKTTEDIWREKMGLTMPIEATGPMKRGTRLEKVAIEEFSADTGRSVATGQTFYRHPLHKHLVGHLDGQIMDGAGDWSGVLEVKIPNVSTYMRYQREGLGDYINIQLQHYLAVTGKPWGAVYIWSPEVWQGFTVEAKQDPAIIDLIYSAGDKFWKHVEAGTMPPPATAANLPDFPKHSGVIVKVDSKDWAAAANDLRMATDLMKEAEFILESSKARIKELMAGLDAAEGHGVRCYNKWSEGRRTVDKARAIAEILNLRKMVLNLAPNTVFVEDIEDIITKRGKPFQTFKSYFISNSNQIEA